MNTLTPQETYEYRLDGKDIKIVDKPINQDMNIEFKSSVYLDGNNIVFEKYETDTLLTQIMEFDKENIDKIRGELEDFGATKDKPMHAKLLFEKDEEAVKNEDNKGDGKDYGVSFVMEETQNNQEYKIFMWIVVYTVAFGLLLIVFLRKLKKLTHGAEDQEGTNFGESEGFELADGAE